MVNFSEYQEQQAETSMGNLATQKSKTAFGPAGATNASQDGRKSSEDTEVSVFENMFDKLLKENKIDPVFLLSKLKQYEGG